MIHDPVSPAPLREWIEQQLAALANEHAPVTVLAGWMGWLDEISVEAAHRRMHRWRYTAKALPWDDVYEALTAADAPWWELYPERDDTRAAA